MRWPWEWFGRSPGDDEQLRAAKVRYKESLSQLRTTTACIKSARSDSLDEVQRRVQNADSLMKQAFRGRMPSGG